MDNACVQSLAEVDPSLRGGAVTIGKFDGVHQGHRRLIARCRELAGGAAPVVALTFNPPPDSALRGIDMPHLDSAEGRCRLLREAGADAVVIVRTDELLLAMTPDEFVERMLMRKLAPRWVVEGPHFHYGVGRSGNIATLQAAGRRLGFGVEVVEPVMIELNGQVERVSSSLVRRLVTVGQVEAAAQCLARPFALYGPVIHGAGKGRTIDCPTANIDTGNQVVPADGVYAGWGTVGGRRFAAAISIGDRPTFASGSRAVEAYLIGLDEDLYGKHLTLEFLQRLREQETYDTLDALRRQIEKDIASVRRICGV